MVMYSLARDGHVRRDPLQFDDPDEIEDDDEETGEEEGEEDEE